MRLSWAASFLAIIAALAPIPSLTIAHAAPDVPPECVQLVIVAKADFDGSGRPGVALGLPREPSVYRSIIVRSGTGRTLLDITSPTMYWEVFVASIGAPYPILITGTPSGNWLRVQAWMYRPEEKGLAALKWDGQDYAWGREPHVDPLTRRIVMGTERGTVSYAFKDGELKSSQ